MTRSSYRVKFAGGAGYDLAGIVDEPQLESTESVAPVAVFSHCFTCNKDLKAIVRISRGLAAKGIRVLRFDMTGLGTSDGDFSQTNFTTNLADLTAAIDFASGSLGPVVSLIGHSFGGAASLATAGIAASANNVDNLSSIRCVVTLAAPSDTKHLASLLASMNPTIVRDGIGDVVIGGVRWTIRDQMLVDFRQHDLPGLISQIRLPVLLFQSPVDATVGFDHALRIISLVQSESGGRGSASLILLDQSDHLITNSADIEYITEIAAAFMRRHAPLQS